MYLKALSSGIDRVLDVYRQKLVDVEKKVIIMGSVDTINKDDLETSYIDKNEKTFLKMNKEGMLLPKKS